MTGRGAEFRVEGRGIIPTGSESSWRAQGSSYHGQLTIFFLNSCQWEYRVSQFFSPKMFALKLSYFLFTVSGC